MPQEPNSFVGREHELKELRSLVPGTRMVTLTGPGGIGKTRLALRVLAELADQFPDGARFVELADLTNPDLVVARVASAVGVAEEHGRPLIDTLADALHLRRLLLALDNCEHLLDACARLCQRLLASSAELRLLATSREPLRVAGEVVRPVAPLPVASRGRFPADAVRLFSDRALAASPGFALTVANVGAVAELCRSLEGIPLAIELAAARARTLTVEQIRMRVADRFGLLTMGDRAAPPRQQTLRAAIDWSHDLLTSREQVLLRRLSAFAGWSVEMAENVCADEQVPAGRVLDTLGALVDKSLVVPEPEALGQARFRMLDTIREYASEKLTAADEAAVTGRRLRAYVLAVAERNFAVGMALVPAPWQDRVDVFRRYDVDASNVWLVLSECLADGDVRTGLRVCTAIRPCMLVRGEFDLGCEWVDAFLARPEAADVEPGILGPALIGRAQLTLSSDPASAEPLARAGLDLCRVADDDFWTAAGLNLLSEIAVHLGQPDQAERLGKEAAAISVAAGDGWNEGWALGIRAAVAGLRGQLREAADLAAASIRVMRAIDHRWGIARAQLGLGDLARVRGDFADARQRYTEALAYLREVNARPEIARCLSGLGWVAMDSGAITLAREYLTDSLRLSRDIGTRIGVARGLESFAALAVREGDPERAVLFAAGSTALRKSAGLPPLPGARAERYLAPARRLSAPSAAQLWERGLEMVPQAVISMAFEPSAAHGEHAEPTPGAPDAIAAPPSLLTPRELEIAALVVNGRSNKAIADELVISPATVARHIANIMTKLGFRSRAQIAAWTVDHRLPRRLSLPLLGASLVDGQFRRGVGFQPFVGNLLAAEHRTASAEVLTSRAHVVSATVGEGAALIRGSVMTNLFRVEDEPGKTRVDYWQHVMASTYIPYRITTGGGSLRGQVRRAEIGPVTVLDMHTSAMEYSRTADLIRDSDHGMCKIGLARRGRGVFEQDGRQAMLMPGEFLLMDLSRPNHVAIERWHQGSIVVFPQALLPVRHNELQQLTAVRFSPRDPYAALVISLVTEVTRHLDAYEDDRDPRIGRAFLDLLSLAVATRLDRVAAVPAESRQNATMLRIQSFIERHLADPCLSPGMIAAAHHISVRGLHKMYEAEEQTIAASIRQQRLERSRQDLLDPGLRDRPVSAVGARWGFQDPAAFSRAFRAAYGVPPAEYRAKAPRGCRRVDGRS